MRRLLTVTLQIETDDDDSIAHPNLLRRGDPKSPVTMLSLVSSRTTEILLDTLVQHFDDEGLAPVRINSEYRLADSLDDIF